MAWSATILGTLGAACWGADVGEVTLIPPPQPSSRERLATAELGRYLYLRTGRLPARGSAPGNGLTIRLVRDATHLGAQEYTLKSDGRMTTISGGDDLGLLYGAYRYCERLGVRFYLHGDVLPDDPCTTLPEVDETGKPLFRLRGLNSWGAHPFGVDAWGTDDYKAVFAQMAKMRLNFLGLHCYPELHPYAEPTVWLGTAQDVGPRGEVTASYPSRFFQTTLKGPWGPMLPKKTSDYDFGGASLFADDAWTPEVMRGLDSGPDAPATWNAVFNRMGSQFHDAFGFARELGVKTCVGIEAPLRIPKVLQERLQRQGKDPNDPQTIREVYEGTFRRIAAAHPLDYFWIWTPESWNYAGNKPGQYAKVVRDVQLAQEALQASGAPFALATCGWVLGPQHDRTAFDADLAKQIPMSAISRQYGHAEIDPAFGRITGRETWAIPWLESDEKHGLAAMQPFVGRIRRDAADALAYGCTGLLGVHWRTDIIAPNIAALAAAGWEQRSWNPAPGEAPRPPAAKAPRSLPCDDFYADWAVANFGTDAGKDLGRIFATLDGRMPLSVAGGCPAGSLTGERRPWAQVKDTYAFVDEVAACRTRIRGAGNLERFAYWFTTLSYHRSLHQLRCALGEFEARMEARQLDAALEAYRSMLALYGTTYRLLLESVQSSGGIAGVVTLENYARFRPVIIDLPGQRLAAARGEALPADAKPPRSYQGRPRLIVPTVRSLCQRGEKLQVQVIALAREPYTRVAIAWRPLGGDSFQTIDAACVARAVYRVSLPPATGDFEYHLLGTIAGGQQVIWPATAPASNQSVVVGDGGENP